MPSTYSMVLMSNCNCVYYLLLCVTLESETRELCCLQVMEEAIERLEKRHKEHIILYDPSGVSGGGHMYVYRKERDGKGKTDRHNEQKDIKKCPHECAVL